MGHTVATVVSRLGLQRAQRDGEAFLAGKFDAMPAGTDIVVAHGPPHGLGDRAPRPGGYAHVGSTAMLDALQRVQPRLMVCGHIHPGYGTYRLGGTEIINASLVDDAYRPVHAIVQTQI